MLLRRCSNIILRKSLSKNEVIKKLDEIGTLITKRVNFVNESGNTNKHNVQDDFDQLQLPKNEISRALGL